MVFNNQHIVNGFQSFFKHHSTTLRRYDKWLKTIDYVLAAAMKVNFNRYQVNA